MDSKTNQGCLRTAWNATACMTMQIVIWPRSGVNTFRDTKFAVGRFRQRTGKGPVQLTKMQVSFDYRVSDCGGRTN
jgi:hypothetical protein